MNWLSFAFGAAVSAVAVSWLTSFTLMKLLTQINNVLRITSERLEIGNAAMDAFLEGRDKT